MSFSSMDRDGFSRFPNGQYGSMPISNGGGGSPVSSPAEESPEATFKPTRFHAGNNGSHLGDEAKLRKPQVRYRECLKNHAASIGGHAIDGCGEFLPSGKEGTLEALKCAACFCHRNFHRREFVGSDGEYACSCGAAARSQALSGPFALNQSLRPMSPGVREAKGHQLPSSADISPHAHMVMPLAQFDDDDDDDDDDDEPPQHPRPGSSKKKRFRTKFTTEQKEKMLHFAEILGWKISRHDEDAVQEFCNDVRVKRNVFKVWMHNNKHSSGKKQGGGSEVGRNCDSPPEY